MRLINAMIWVGIAQFFAVPGVLAAPDTKVFQINTVKLGADGHETGIVAGAKLDSIKVIGLQGKSTDLQCNGISDNSGQVTCVIKACNNDPLTNYYEIDFKSPELFGVVEPAKININNCKVTPSPAIAKFISRILIDNLVIQDRIQVFGEANTMKPSAMVAGVTDTSYANNLGQILNAPFGAYRAVKLRKTIQDASFVANQEKDRPTAIAYQSLVTAHANTLVAVTAENVGIKGVVNSSPGNLSTLTQNIEAVLAAPKTEDWKGLIVTQDFKKVADSAKNGVLANFELNQLERIGAASAYACPLCQ
ncbi:MAG: hypothetical protein HQ483_10900 [Rhodospirillales bacterium]|nr:hypothetical protein [Rhodospirillales bacterium]